MNISGIRVDIDYKESRGNEVKKIVADISHAKKTLGYNPEYDNYHGIKETVEQYKKDMRLDI